MFQSILRSDEVYLEYQSFSSLTLGKYEFTRTQVTVVGLGRRNVKIPPNFLLAIQNTPVAKQKKEKLFRISKQVYFSN